MLALEERLVQRWQNALPHLLHLDGINRRFATEFRRRGKPGRKGHRHVFLVAWLEPRELPAEAGNEAVLFALDLLPCLRDLPVNLFVRCQLRHGLAVDRALIGQFDVIALLRRPFRHLKVRALLPQTLDHGIDLGFSRFDGSHLDRDPEVFRQFKLGLNIDGEGDGRG